jgi:hypothetical protein
MMPCGMGMGVMALGVGVTTLDPGRRVGIT